MRLLVCFFLLSQLAFAAPKHKVILGVFAHPDDEIMVGAVLARYAKQGVDVYIAYATDGQRGAKPFSGIPNSARRVARRPCALRNALARSPRSSSA